MSMARQDINFQFDFRALDAFERVMASADGRFKQNGLSAMQSYNTLAEEGSRALAPHDGGELEISIEAVRPTWNGSELKGGLVSNSQYALRRHEEPGRPGKRDKYDNGAKEEDYYEDGLGRRTREKDPWMGERAGNKFMDRAVTLTEEEFDRIMAVEVLERTLGGG